MRILIDCDDTIWNLLEAWVTILNERYDENVIWNHIDNWDVSLAYPNLTKQQIYEPLCEEKLWTLVKPKFDAVKYVPKLYEEGHEIYFVTTTDYRNIEFKVKLLEDYFPDIPIQNLITTYHKNLIRGDILIDDYINNFKERSSGILFTTTYNKEFNVEELGLHRCDNWEEIYNYINEIKPV